MKLLVTATGYFPGSELAVAEVLKQALATLSLQTGIKFALQEESAEDSTQAPSQAVKEVAEAPVQPEAAAEPVYRVIAVDGSAGDLREMSVEEVLQKSILVKGCDDLRGASALAHQLTRDPSNNVYQAIVVTSSGDVVVHSVADEGRFGIRFVSASGVVLGRKSWIDSAAEAHQAALMASLGAVAQNVPWTAVQVFDFRTSKHRPACLAVVSRD